MMNARMRGSWIGGVFGLSALLLCANAALAQDAAPATPAQALYDRGLSDWDAGRYDAAAASFQASLRAEPTFGASFMVADCLEHMGRLAAAYNQFMHARSEAEKTSNAERLKKAEARAELLAPRVARLKIALADRPGTVTIQVGGETIAPDLAAAGHAVAPGAADIEVSAPGKVVWRRHMDRLGAGALVQVDVPALVSAPPLVTEPATPTGTVPITPPFTGSTTPGDPPSTWESHRWSIITGGVAVALAGVGAGMGVKTWTHYSDLAEVCGARPTGCTQDEKDSVEGDALLTNVFFGAAGATALGAAGIFFFAEQGPSRVQVGVAPGFVRVRGAY